ncbi:ABC transporter permease subunit [Chlorobium limicola]
MPVLITRWLYIAAAVLLAFVSVAQGATLSSLDDLKQKKIGVLLGSIHERYAIKAWPEASILQYQSPSDLVVAVKSGKADAAIYSYDELMVILRQNDDLAILGPSLFSTSLGMAFHHDNDALREKFNRFLRKINDSGQHDAMIRYWMRDGATRMPSIPESSGKETITVGILGDNGLPFAVVSDNRLVGYSIELLERFAAYSGKRIVYEDLEFGSLIAALASRKIDMIGAVMSITEERRQKVAFSDPYYEQDTYVYTLKSNLAQPTQDTQGVDANGRMSLFGNIADSFKSNIVQENRWRLILDGFVTTFVISIFSGIFGTLLGSVICYMRMSHARVLSLPAEIFISLLRGTPVLVLLMIVYYVVFSSINIDPVLVAVIAFGLNFAAYAAEIFRSGIEGIDKGQSEAGIAIGFTKTGTFLFIILPQTIRRILPVYKGEFISLLKMTSVVGYIAVQDLTKAGDIIRSRTFDAFFPLIMVAALYFFLAWVLTSALQYIECKTAPKHRKRQAEA